MQSNSLHFILFYKTELIQVLNLFFFKLFNGKLSLTNPTLYRAFPYPALIFGFQLCTRSETTHNTNTHTKKCLISARKTIYKAHKNLLFRFKGYNYITK